MMRTSVSATSTRWGEGAEGIPPITAPVEPDALPRDIREQAHRGGRDGLISGAFERRLRPLGIDPCLVAERLQDDDAVFQRRIGQIGDA